MTRSLSSLIDYAKEIAHFSKQRKKHVSIIIRDNKILAAEANGFEVPNAYAYRGYRSLHSEIHAFMKVNQRKNLTLYNFRFNNQGKLRMAKPCNICMPWCEAVFEHIYYSTNEGLVVKLIKGTSNVPS
tara:strand:+ start:369 stop:752 length:384 start_codon:yes stop_codon:yes gene_type:complete